MNNKIVLLALCSGLLYACGDTVRNPTKPDVAKDTLVYTYKTLKQRAHDCGNKPDSACTVVKITYPEFKDAPILNDKLKKQLVVSSSGAEKPDTSFTNFATSFIKGYEEDKKTAERTYMFYTVDTKSTVIRQDSSLTTLQSQIYTYTGGAHGNTYIGFINWDTKKKQGVFLNDIMNPGYRVKLTAIAEKIFRKNENLTDTSSLKADYFFKDAKFSLNDNFLITPLGLRFLYNQYEIKPYAAGTTDLLIPYDKIKSLLKPHTVTAQYIH